MQEDGRGRQEWRVHVSTGDYRVVWEDAFPALHRDPKFLNAVEQRGTIVTVQTGGVPSVEVRAIPAF